MIMVDAESLTISSHTRVCAAYDGIARIGADSRPVFPVFPALLKISLQMSCVIAPLL